MSGLVLWKHRPPLFLQHKMTLREGTGETSPPRLKGHLFSTFPDIALKGRSLYYVLPLKPPLLDRCTTALLHGTLPRGFFPPLVHTKLGFFLRLYRRSRRLSTFRARTEMSSCTGKRSPFSPRAARRVNGVLAVRSVRRSPMVSGRWTAGSLLT